MTQNVTKTRNRNTLVMPSKVWSSIHSMNAPFCKVGTCRCHTDQTLLSLVHQAVQDGLLTDDEANHLIAGDMK